MTNRTNRISVLAVLASLAAVSSASADVLIGASIYILEFGITLLLAPATLIIETIVAWRILKVSLVKCLAVAIVANAVSGFVGFVLASFVQVPGLRRSDEALKVLMVLCVPLCLLSIWIEASVARYLLPLDRRPRALRWAVEANLASYAMIVVVLLVSLRLFQLGRLPTLGELLR